VIDSGPVGAVFTMVPTGPDCVEGLLSQCEFWNVCCMTEPIRTEPAGFEAPLPSTVNEGLPAAVPAWEREVLEKLLLGTLREQRALRRWRMFWRCVWLLLAGVLVWLWVSADQALGGKNVPHTALVEIRGEMTGGSETSAESVVAALRSAFAESEAQAVVLLVDSPGGSPVQAGIIYDEIARLKAVHGKPLYVVVEEMCTSAAYYVAAAADRIYVDKASMVGSIGVLMDGFGFTAALEKWGVERRLLTAGDNKGFLDPFSPQSEEQRAWMQHLLDQIHQQFIAAVKTGRGERLKVTPETFSGLFWTGQQAVAMGLADQLGSVDYVAREVVKAEEIVDYTHRGNVAEQLMQKLGASAGAGAVKVLAALRAPYVR